ncbi:MAG TPA: DedA family protein, partial [Nitrososphaera sp.]|nr:DedA family protein [Nitrososphaera sp.]
MVLIEILEPLVNFIVSLVSSLGYLGIFVLMVLESALIPIPSEIIMPFSGFLVQDGRLNFTSTVLAGSIGNLAGSTLTYYLGKTIRRERILKYGKFVFLREHHLEFAEQLFQKHGSKISFAGRLLPAVRTYVSLPAGVTSTPFKKFMAYTFFGSVIWNVFLVYLGVRLGENWKNIDKY